MPRTHLQGSWKRFGKVVFRLCLPHLSGSLHLILHPSRMSVSVLHLRFFFQASWKAKQSKATVIMSKNRFVFQTKVLCCLTGRPVPQARPDRQNGRLLAAEEEVRIPISERPKRIISGFPPGSCKSKTIVNSDFFLFQTDGTWRGCLQLDVNLSRLVLVPVLKTLQWNLWDDAHREI